MMDGNQVALPSSYSSVSGETLYPNRSNPHLAANQIALQERHILSNIPPPQQKFSDPRPIWGSSSNPNYVGNQMAVPAE